jgi:hypothetical protein
VLSPPVRWPGRRPLTGTAADTAGGAADVCGPGSPGTAARVVWGLTTRPRGSPAGFPPVSRLPARIPPRHPPPAGVPARGALRLGPFGRCPVRFPFGVPPGLPSRAVLMLAPPPDGSAGEGPGRPGPRSPVPACCATPSPGRAAWAPGSRAAARCQLQPAMAVPGYAAGPGAAGEAGMRTAGITRPPAHLALAVSSALSAAEADVRPESGDV